MRITLVTPQSSRAILHRVRGSGFYVQNLIKALSKYFPENEYVLSSYDKIDKTDLVHFPYFEPFFLTLPLYKKFKTVVTVHDLTPLVFPEEFPSGIKGKLKWAVQKKNLEGADLIITDSRCSKKDICRFTGIKEVKVKSIYLSAGEEFRKINLSENKVNNLREKYNIPEKFALYVGDATWNKNLPSLVKAAAKTGIPLVMVGKALKDESFDKSNPWNKDLFETQNLAKNSSGKVYLLGFVSSDDLVSLYNMATLFIMPSFYEGFGLPILEAMRCGCPVITTDKGSLGEIAGNAAFKVDPYSIESIADGIEKVFSDESIQKKLSEQGLENSKQFSWKKTAEDTMDGYISVVKRR